MEGRGEERKSGSRPPLLPGLAMLEPRFGVAARVSERRAPGTQANNSIIVLLQHRRKLALLDFFSPTRLQSHAGVRMSACRRRKSARRDPPHPTFTLRKAIAYRRASCDGLSAS